LPIYSKAEEHAFTTPRVDLEPLRETHASETWPQLNDARMWQFFPMLRPSSRADLEAIYARRIRGPGREDEVWENWICRDRSSRALIGEMQATILCVSRSAYIAYAVYPAYQRQGYAREAAQAVVDHLRAAHRVERVLAEMDVRNEASFGLAESLGFRRIETRTARDRNSTSFGDEYLYELRVH